MSARRDELEAAFRSIGVVRLEPGFFDEPAFLKEEENIKANGIGLLDFYAEYCLETAVGEGYLENARAVVNKVKAFIGPLLAEENRDGRCMPATLLISRFLEVEGIWNFIVKGGVVVRFPTESKLAPKILEPEDGHGGTFGHTWIVAPPFDVIDLTISRQFYSPKQLGIITDDVVQERVDIEIDTMFPSHQTLSETFKERFCPRRATINGCTISYVPYGIGGPNESFPNMGQPVLGGYTPFELYKRFKSQTSPEQ